MEKTETAVLRRRRPRGLASFLLTVVLLGLAAGPCLGGQARGSAGPVSVAAGRADAAARPLVLAAKKSRDPQRHRRGYHDLTPEEKARLEKKLKKWESLSPEKQSPAVSGSPGSMGVACSGWSLGS